MNRIEQGILIGGLILAMGIPGGLYFFGVKPAASEIATIRGKMDAAVRERDTNQKVLSGQQVEWEQLTDEIRRLHLFDLREEKNVETTIINRSNLVLIGLSEIFERNGVALDSLGPLPMEKVSVLIDGTPQAGVNRRKYAIKARGGYRGLIAAIDAIKDLPPTMSVDAYDVSYLDSNQNQARVSLDLTLSFNFLLTPPQLDQIQVPQASSSSQPQKVGAKLGRLWAWIMPPAHAQTTPKSRKPDYVIPVKKDAVLGRSEPFLPLTPQSSSSPMAAAKPSQKNVPQLNLSLLGVMFSGDSLPSALIRVDNRRISVRPGSRLAGDAEVLAIGGDYILVKHGGIIHRVKLSRGLEAPEPDAQERPLPDLPLPPPLPIPVD